MQHNFSQKMKKNTGFSLVETLLSMFIISGLLVVITLVTQTHAERLLHKAMGQYVDQVRVAVHNILKNPGNFRTIYTAVEATADDFIQFDIDDLRNGGFVAGIAAADNLEDSFVDNTLFDNGLDIIIRLADNSADPNDIEALEIFVVSNDRMRFLRARGIASELKGYGGTLDNLVNLESVYASWQVPLANLNNTNWHTAVTTGTPPSPTNGAYVIAYEHIDSEDLSGDYLYRTADSTRPELNRMYTNLDLGNNNILGVDDLGGIQVGGEDYRSSSMTINSKVILNGASLTVDNDTTLQEGNMYINSTASAGNNLTIQGTGNNPDATGRFITGGNIVINNELRASRLDVNQANFNQSTTLNGLINVGTLNVQGNASLTSINSPVAAITGNIDSINVSGSVVTNQIDAQALSVQGSNTFGAVDTQVSGPVNVNRLISNGDMNINSITVNNFGACDNGC